MAHSIGSCLMDSTICCSRGVFSSLRGLYLASCRARADLKGVGVQGDESRIERRMFGVLNISLSFWGLREWSIRGLESTGELMGKLSLSDCSELIDWLRNESMTDSMNSGIVFENVGLLLWLPLLLLLLLLLRPLFLWARVAEALSSGRQLWSRGRAGAGAW